MKKQETAQQRELRLIIERQMRDAQKRHDEYREMFADEQRKLQAKALWSMYRRGELVRKTMLNRDFLYSH